MTASKFNDIIDLIDRANSCDPNQELFEGKPQPKEIVYSARMSDMLLRYEPQSSDLLKIAVHGQHIERWKLPRKDFPLTPAGYKQWRTTLYQRHADRVGELMLEAGYDEPSIDAVKNMISKKGLKSNPDTQAMEDVVVMVFIEHYMYDFSAQKAEYDEAKWIDIIKKTWKKMSDRGRAFVLAGHVKLPEPLVPLILKSIS